MAALMELVRNGVWHPERAAAHASSLARMGRDPVKHTGCGALAAALL